MTSTWKGGEGVLIFAMCSNSIVFRSIAHFCRWGEWWGVTKKTPKYKSNNVLWNFLKPGCILIQNFNLFSRASNGPKKSGARKFGKFVKVLNALKFCEHFTYCPWGDEIAKATHVRTNGNPGSKNLCELHTHLIEDPSW